MWVDPSYTGIPPAGGTPTANVFNANNQISGAAYDPAGNQTSVNGDMLLYDGEGRLVQVTQPPAFGGGAETYLYDGNSNRVQKTGFDGTVTVYVYDALG